MPLLNIGIYPPHIHPETSPSQNYPPPDPTTTRRYWILYHTQIHQHQINQTTRSSLDTRQIIYGITRNLDNVYVYLRAENAFFIQTSGLLERSVPVGWLEERDIDAFARVVENTKIESGVNDEAGVNAGRGRSYDSQVWVRDVLFAALNTVAASSLGEGTRYRFVLADHEAVTEEGRGLRERDGEFYVDEDAEGRPRWVGEGMSNGYHHDD